MFLFGYIQEKQINYYILVIVFSGFISSLLYGWKAVVIFGYPKKDDEMPEHANSWWIHQFWFNFIGSLFGWFLIILFIYIIKIVGIEEITLAHLLILIFGVLGITGLFPSFLAQIPNILHLLTKRFGDEYFKK
ncbi:MAG: hypothetical protein ABIJ84_03660 [bacterium]